MAKHEIMVLACQVGPFHLTYQMNSEMNCIATTKCPESQKLDTRRRGVYIVHDLSGIHTKTRIMFYSYRATTNVQNNRYC